jgi:hypothetical protein
MGKPKKVPGLDYLAEPGDEENISFGVIRTPGPQGETINMEGAVCRRMFPVGRPTDPLRRWDKPTCARAEVLLPEGASDALWDVQALCRAYDEASFPGLRDVLLSTTVRAPELENGHLRIHEHHHMVTEYARCAFPQIRRLPVIVILHIPAKAAMPGPVHWHLLAPCRRLSPAAGPSTFCTDLLEDGRLKVEREFADWRRGWRLSE